MGRDLFKPSAVTEVTKPFNNSIVHLQYILLKYISETSFRHHLSTTSFCHLATTELDRLELICASVKLEEANRHNYMTRKQ
jgi:hypothetical protein